SVSNYGPARGRSQLFQHNRPIAVIQHGAIVASMIDFADRVRISFSADTERLGLAGRKGQVCGSTTPSLTGVSVIGSTVDDYAINVQLEEVDEALWFSEELVELIDKGAGTVISLDGHDAEWVRLPNGHWEERPCSK
ncbi:hypothetical protein, partial [Sphingomonas sp. CFBP 13706]|uniref:hypothetical protein n=1 Tax=Sphingomonas sp. CFBP 13706 TaxID=2775314 RepID=UPI001A7EBD75